MLARVAEKGLHVRAAGNHKSYVPVLGSSSTGQRETRRARVTIDRADSIVRILSIKRGSTQNVF